MLWYIIIVTVDNETNVKNGTQDDKNNIGVSFQPSY